MFEMWFHTTFKSIFSFAAAIEFQKLSIPFPWNGFFLRPPPPPLPHLSGNSSQASYIYLHIWAFENPHPSGISNPFCGGSMDIFWNYTIDYSNKNVCMLVVKITVT